MGQPERNEKSLRLLFFDNIRFIIISFVVLQHVALVYRVYGVPMDFTQYLCKFVVSITDVFMMPVLFFIAGYFAPASIQRRGTRRFILGKIRRIWIPWFLGVTLILPVSVYFLYVIRCAREAAAPMRYFDYWSRFMGSACEFHTGFTTSPDQFSHKHLWFLSVLFTFFVVYGLLHGFRERFLSRSTPEESKRTRQDPSAQKVLVLAGILCAAGFFVVKLFFRWGYQAILVASVIHFEPSRLVFYVVYFCMGIYAYSRGWFAGGKSFGGVGVWTALCISSFGLYTYFNFSGSLTLTVGVKLMLSALRSLLCLSIFVVLVSFAERFLNRPSKTWRRLSSNSYTIYIIHYPIHAAAAVLLLNSGIPVLLKFWLVFGTTIAASYLLSEYAVKPFPKTSVAGMILLNIVLFALL